MVHLSGLITACKHGFVYVDGALSTGFYAMKRIPVIVCPSAVDG
jgi:hypothetical protein